MTIKVGFIRSTHVGGKRLPWKAFIFEVHAGETVNNRSDIWEKCRQTGTAHLELKLKYKILKTEKGYVRFLKGVTALDY